MSSRPSLGGAASQPGEPYNDSRLVCRDCLGLLDEIFGQENFLNEIIWSYRTGDSILILTVPSTPTFATFPSSPLSRKRGPAIPHRSPFWITAAIEERVYKFFELMTRGMLWSRRRRYFRRHTSAASTLGCFVLALRVVRKSLASLNPAIRNSSRKAPPSFAPATQANQFDRLLITSRGSASRRMSSAAYTDPPLRTTRASS